MSAGPAGMDPVLIGLVLSILDEEEDEENWNPLWTMRGAPVRRHRRRGARGQV